MRLDVITIFPDYLAPLDLSLIGRARREGLVDLRVHDLRDFAHDRHCTVDGTPYGGGAGMVMRPEPWGEALDEVCGARRPEVPHLLVPGPGGTPFTQAMAHQLAQEPWLVFACGRYEGIDERVCLEAAEQMPVSVVSLGDYVLGGGEVAALVIAEAVLRLLPGVIGNAESLVEESHTAGLLEYPVYTKPPVWRGHEVPAVLRSGDHGVVSAWREQRSRERTAARRPDLLPLAATVTGIEGAPVQVRPAVPADAGELLTLQRACWLTEAQEHDSLAIPALGEGLVDVQTWLQTWRTWVVRADGRLIGAVRARAPEEDPTVWDIGRLMVAPDLQGRGIGRALLELAQDQAPPSVDSFRLFTGAASDRNQRMYRKAGFRLVERGEHCGVPTVVLIKRR